MKAWKILEEGEFDFSSFSSNSLKGFRENVTHCRLFNIKKRYKSYKSFKEVIYRTMQTRSSVIISGTNYECP